MGKKGRPPAKSPIETEGLIAALKALR